MKTTPAGNARIVKRTGDLLDEICAQGFGDFSAAVYLLTIAKQILTKAGDHEQANALLFLASGHTPAQLAETVHFRKRPNKDAGPKPVHNADQVAGHGAWRRKQKENANAPG